ncbi:TNF receptor-associated factor 3, partial [Geodia barretti]
ARRLFQCPVCQEKIDPTKPQQFFPDKSCQNDMKTFQVKCGCGWQGPLLDWEAHQQTCPANDLPESATLQVAEVRKMRSEVTELKKMVVTTKSKVESLTTQVQEVKELVQGAQFGGGGGGGGGAVGAEATPTTKRLSDKYTQLNDIVSQLVADVEQHKGTITQMTSAVDKLNQSIPRYDSILEELNLKIEIMEVKSTTGVYIWKVNELQRRYQDARIGKTVSLYSPPFYTTIHGYRLCLRCYLYGDGQGKGTHISLFVVLMRGEYDDLLAWPFSHRVSLSLINQDHPLSPEKAITHKFVPNSDSSSFQKPKDTFNIASGFPEFAPLNIISNPSFVKNDTIYFRVKLDSPDSPTGPDTVMV